MIESKEEARDRRFRVWEKSSKTADKIDKRDKCSTCEVKGFSLSVWGHKKLCEVCLSKELKS